MSRLLVCFLDLFEFNLCVSEVLDYLESLADAKPEKIPVPADYTAKTPTSTVQSSTSQTKNAKAEILNRNPKPSILKRKRPKMEQMADSETQEQIEPQVVDDDDFQINNSVRIVDHDFEQNEDQQPMKLTPVQNQIAEAVGLR
jgi:hypothetical protein